MDDPFEVLLCPRVASTPSSITEPLWTISIDGHRIDCQLRSHGECGIEAEFLKDGEYLRGRRFSTHALAVEWAILEKQEWRRAMLS
jgi:hypothetical protein